MRFQKFRLAFLATVSAVALGAFAFGFSAAPEQAPHEGGKADAHDPVAAAALVPFQQRNLRALPPKVESASVQLLKEGKIHHLNALLRVRFVKGQGLPNQLTIQPDDHRVILRDDGRGGDAKPGDGEYTAVIHLDLKEFEQNQKRLQEFAKAERPVFQGRTMLKPKPAKVPLLDLERLKKFEIIQLPFPFPLGIAVAVDPKRSLMITDLKVVEDPGRTFNPCQKDPLKAGTPMGKWTFGYLMQQMANTGATGVDSAHFVRRWLRRWESPQTINDWSVAERTQIRNKIIIPWEKKSGGPGMPLNLAQAPFKLLAIVNRIDLHENLVYGGGSAGEARFIFGALDENCNPLPFTVIFEYGIKRSGCAGLRSWARQWTHLSTLPLGSPAYNAALEAITEQFAVAGADPAKPNGSALNQLRTNEIALSGPWELREFQIFDTDSDAHHLREVTVKQTPDLSVNQTARLVDYVNEAPIPNHTVPLDFPVGEHFLGGSSLVPSPSFFWNQPSAGPAIVVREKRHLFSLATCNSCHGGETQTAFLHVAPAPFGTEASLSGFLTGISVNDPADGAPSRTFNDLLRRAGVLDQLANMPCFFHLFREPLLMTH